MVSPCNSVQGPEDEVHPPLVSVRVCCRCSRGGGFASVCYIGKETVLVDPLWRKFHVALGEPEEQEFPAASLRMLAASIPVVKVSLASQPRSAFS